MNTVTSKLLPMAIASVICGVALAGGGKDDHMKMMDADGDGSVTATEHAAGAKMMFTKMDANKDGRVTAAEMDAAQPMMGHKDKDKMATNEDGHDKENAADKNYGKGRMMSSAEKIATIDTNGDGALTAEEHAAGAKKMFTKMDADHDGALTAQEMQEGHRANMSASDE